MQALLLLSVLGITKVVVITPPAVSEPLVTDVLRELRVAGYTVDRANEGDLALSAEAHDAVAAMLLGESVNGITVDVWGALGDQTKARHKEMEIHNAGDRRGAALRAVEMVRGVLLELGVQPPTPISDFANPYEPVTGSKKKDAIAEIDAAPADTATAELARPPPRRRFSWLVGAGAGLLDVGKPQGAASLMLGRRVGPLLADLELTGAFTTIEGARGSAKATVRPWAARFAVGPIWSFTHLDVSPFSALSLDLLAVRGSAPAPFVAHAPLRLRPQVSAGARLIHHFAGGTWVGARAEAGWLAPARVTIAGSRVLDVGPVAIIGELMVGWALD